MKNIFFGLIATIIFTNLTMGQASDKFNNDSRVKDVVEIGKSLSNILPTDIELINKKRVEIDNIVNELVKEYGKENIIKYLEDNVKLENDSKLRADGDNCHRRRNGTVNTDGCNGWEFAAYMFSAAWNCGPGEATDWYYNCCQAAVCRNC